MFKKLALTDDYQERKNDRRKKFEEQKGLKMRTCPCCSGSGHYKDGDCDWCSGTGKCREDKSDQDMRLQNPEEYMEMNRSLRDRG